MRRITLRSYQDNKKAKGKDQAFLDKIDEPSREEDEDLFDLPWSRLRSIPFLPEWDCRPKRCL